MKNPSIDKFLSIIPTHRIKSYKNINKRIILAEISDCINFLGIKSIFVRHSNIKRTKTRIFTSNRLTFLPHPSSKQYSTPFLYSHFFSPKNPCLEKSSPSKRNSKLSTQSHPLGRKCASWKEILGDYRVTLRRSKGENVSTRNSDDISRRRSSTPSARVEIFLHPCPGSKKGGNPVAASEASHRGIEGAWEEG